METFSCRERVIADLWVRYMNNEHVDGVIEQPMLSGGPGILLHHTSLAVFKDYGQHRRLAVPQDILFTRPKGGYVFDHICEARSAGNCSQVLDACRKTLQDISILDRFMA